MATDSDNSVLGLSFLRRGTGILVPDQNPPFPPVDGGQGDSPSPLAERGLGPRPEALGGGEKSVPIESISTGDFVFSHDGKPTRVLRVMKKLHCGPMIGIEHGNRSIWVATNLKVLCKPRPRSLGGNRDWSFIPLKNFERPQKLRRDASMAEKILWGSLRNKQIGIKFRRQHPIGPFIADFYSRKAHLVIEVDGAQHFEPKAMEYDKARAAYMFSMGINTLRFTASEVMRDTGAVVLAIHTHVHNRARHFSDAWWITAGLLVPGDTLFVGIDLDAVDLEKTARQHFEEEVYGLELENGLGFFSEACVISTESPDSNNAQAPSRHGLGRHS